MIVRTEDEIVHAAHLILEYLSGCEEFDGWSDADMVIAMSIAIYSLGHQAGRGST